MSLLESCDAAVMGGGPAGSAVAALLASSGRRTVLLERDRFPRRKVCGEFLSTEAQGLLREIGCLDAVRALAPAAIRRGRFHSVSGREAEFPLGGEAWGLSRWALDATMFQHARDRGVHAFEGANVVAVSGGRLDFELSAAGGPTRRLSLEAPLIIDARGRQAAPAGGGPLYIGYKRRHVAETGRAAEDLLDGAVEIHLFPGGYCGLNAVEGGAVNVCLLARDAWLSALPSTHWEAVADALKAASPSLRRRLEALRPDGPASAVARVRLAAPERPATLTIGDAAGMIAPLCGDGQAMALESALLLAGLVDGRPRAELERAWADAWTRRFSPRLRTGRALQNLLLRPWAAEFAVGLVNLCPPAAGLLVRATRSPY